MSFVFDDRQLQAGLDSLDSKFLIALEMYAHTKAIALESHMKKARVWTDRTNFARQGLRAQADRDGAKVTIYLSHSVEYGPWLELANEKNYAVVEPTVRLQGPSIITDAQGLINKLRVR